jgi:dUTP pyrophosphatase
VTVDGNAFVCDMLRAFGYPSSTHVHLERDGELRAANPQDPIGPEDVLHVLDSQRWRGWGESGRCLRASDLHADNPPSSVYTHEEIVLVLAKDGRMPFRGSEGSSGYDVFADERATINPGRLAVIPTGVRFAMPRSWEGQVRPRSSMIKRSLLTVFGTIDADYTGEVSVALLNVGTDTVHVEAGERIAQLVFAQPAHPRFTRVTNEGALPVTARGSKGWGSTGR